MRLVAVSHPLRGHLCEDGVIPLCRHKLGFGEKPCPTHDIDKSGEWLQMDKCVALSPAEEGQVDQPIHIEPPSIVGTLICPLDQGIKKIYIYIKHNIYIIYIYI